MIFIGGQLPAIDGAGRPEAAGQRRPHVRVPQAGGAEQLPIVGHLTLGGSMEVVEVVVVNFCPAAQHQTTTSALVVARGGGLSFVDSDVDLDPPSTFWSR